MSAPKRDLVQVAAERSGVSAPSSRAGMRREISRAAQRKLAPKEAMKTRQWANQVFRTDDELAEKLAALLEMGDLR